MDWINIWIYFDAHELTNIRIYSDVQALIEQILKCNWLPKIWPKKGCINSDGGKAANMKMFDLCRPFYWNTDHGMVSSVGIRHSLCSSIPWQDPQVFNRSVTLSLLLKLVVWLKISLLIYYFTKLYYYFFIVRCVTLTNSFEKVRLTYIV